MDRKLKAIAMIFTALGLGIVLALLILFVRFTW